MKTAELKNTQRGTERRMLLELPKLLPALRVGQARAVAGADSEYRIDAATPNGRRHRLRAAFRAHAIPGRIRELLRRLARDAAQGRAVPILFSTFVSERVRALCREEQVGYLDLAGNCWLQLEDCYLERVVDRNPFPARGRPASLFAPVSSRIIRALLEEPSRGWQISELARETGVSLGLASMVGRRLIDEAHAQWEDRRLRVTQPGPLLDAWQADYSLDNHQRRAYHSFERDPERLMARVAETGRARTWRYAVTSFGAASQPLVLRANRSSWMGRCFRLGALASSSRVRKSTRIV